MNAYLWFLAGGVTPPTGGRLYAELMLFRKMCWIQPPKTLSRPRFPSCPPPITSTFASACQPLFAPVHAPPPDDDVVKPAKFAAVCPAAGDGLQLTF